MVLSGNLTCRLAQLVERKVTKVEPGVIRTCDRALRACAGGGDSASGGVRGRAYYDFQRKWQELYNEAMRQERKVQDKKNPCLMPMQRGNEHAV